MEGCAVMLQNNNKKNLPRSYNMSGCRGVGLSCLISRRNDSRSICRSKLLFIFQDTQRVIKWYKITRRPHQTVPAGFVILIYFRTSMLESVARRRGFMPAVAYLSSWQKTGGAAVFITNQSPDQSLENHTVSFALNSGASLVSARTFTDAQPL